MARRESKLSTIQYDRTVFGEDIIVNKNFMKPKPRRVYNEDNTSASSLDEFSRFMKRNAIEDE